MRYGYSAVLVTILLCSNPAFAQQAEKKAESGEVCGWELMGEDERTAHRQKMRSLSSREARMKYRQEHHSEMEKRAKEQGKTLRCDDGSG